MSIEKSDSEPGYVTREEVERAIIEMGKGLGGSRLMEVPGIGYSEGLAIPMTDAVERFLIRIVRRGLADEEATAS